MAKSQSYTESYLIVIGHYLARLKTGVVDTFSPSPIQRPQDFEKYPIVYVENCPVCGEGFHCNDVVVSSCGHTYHPFCMTSHSMKSNKCIADFCEEHFDPIWRLSFGFAEPPKQELSRDVIDDRLCSGGMLAERHNSFLLLENFFISVGRLGFFFTGQCTRMAFPLAYFLFLLVRFSPGHTMGSIQGSFFPYHA